MKPDVDKKRLVVALECLSFDDLAKYDTPNIDSLDPHPATSMGCTTRAAVPALLGGFLPFCEYPPDKCGKGHRDMARGWTYPYFLTEYKKAGRLWLYCPNGWVAEYITPYLRREIKPWILKHYAIPDREGEFRLMIDDFLSRDPDSMDGYFAYFHVMETHPPFYPVDCDIPRNTKNREEKEARRKMAVEQTDANLEYLMDLDVDELVVTADHAADHLNTRVFLATRCKR